jgi:hypothetical protein
MKDVAMDMDKVWQDMTAAVATVLNKEWGKAGACVQDALQQEQGALGRIAKERLAGTIDDAQMRRLLEDEKDALKVALLACEVQGKKLVEAAANAATDALVAAIRTTLGLPPV